MQNDKFGYKCEHIFKNYLVGHIVRNVFALCVFFVYLFVGKPQQSPVHRRQGYHTSPGSESL